MRYCEACNRYTGTSKKKFSIVWLILTGGVYAIYRLFVPKNKCNICGLRTVRKKV
jgi:rRNA maturation protein Nop10